MIDLKFSIISKCSFLRRTVEGLPHTVSFSILFKLFLLPAKLEVFIVDIRSLDKH